MVAQAPADRVGPARVPRVRPRQRARRAQRPVRHVVPQGGGAVHRASVAGLPGARHRPPGPAAGHAGRGAQPQALLAGRRLRRDDDARPPGAPRRPRDRRRPARAARAGRQPRRPHPRGAVELHLAGHARAAPQAAPRRRPAAAAGRLPLQGRARPGPLRRHVAQHPRPRPVLLHRLRAAHPDGRDGRPRHERPADRVPDDPGGPGPRAAPHRRAQAALQPTFAVPRAGHLGQADRRSRSRGCRSCARSSRDGARYLGPFRSKRSAEAAVAALHEVVPLRQCTGSSRPVGTGSECVLGRDGPVRRALLGAAVRRGLRGSRRRRDRPPHRRRPPGRRRAAGADGGPVGAGAVRGRGHGPRPAAPPRPRGRPDPADRPAGVQPELVAARRSEAGGWELVCVRYGRLAGTA